MSSMFPNGTIFSVSTGFETAVAVSEISNAMPAVATLASGTVESIDERSASALWTNDALARRQLSSPAVFSSYVAFGDLEGYLHLVSQVDGRFVGRTRIDSDGLRARPLVVGDWLYAFGNGGKLVALTIK